MYETYNWGSFHCLNRKVAGKNKIDPKYNFSVTGTVVFTTLVDKMDEFKSVKVLRFMLVAEFLPHQWRIGLQYDPTKS